MKLAIFDLDGTLTDTSLVDNLCFVGAWDALHGPARINEDWLDFSHQTDSTIYTEACQRAGGEPPATEQIQRFIQEFLTRLKNQAHLRPELFRPLPGANRMLQHLADDSDWTAVVATGGWGLTARFKIEQAGLARYNLPLASSDDGYTREEIINRAISLARQIYDPARFSRLVSMGDGVWDVATALNLNLPFIGVGDNNSLIKAGAKEVIGDYSDLNRFMNLLDRAAPPDKVGI